MKSVIGVGDTLIDIVIPIKNDILIERFGLQRGCMIPIDTDTLRHLFNNLNLHATQPIMGGAAANTIRGLSMLGINSGFVGSVGNDKFGSFFEDELYRVGVTPYIVRHDTPTGICLSLVTPDCERSMATFAGASTLIGKTDLWNDVIGGYDLLYTEGYLIPYSDNLTETICSIAKINKREIAFDLSSYNIVSNYRKQIDSVVEQYVDILFANEQEAAEYTNGLTAEEAARSIASVCKIAIVKLGQRGSIICSGEECIHIAAMQANCIDTTGAGDLYASGFLYGYLHGMDLATCGWIASLVSSRVIETAGADIDDKGWKTIKQELKARGL